MGGGFVVPDVRMGIGPHHPAHHAGEPRAPAGRDAGARGKGVIDQGGMMRRAAFATLLAIIVGVTGTTLPIRAAHAPALAPQLTKNWQAWEQGPDAAAPLYAKERGLVFYDVE